jgi:predicted aldo/keto reductase-like oxidoreductase
MENKYQEALRRIELIKITENYDTKHVLNIGVHEIDQIEEALKEAVAIEPEYRELKAKNTPRKIMFKEGCPQCPYCGRFNTTYNPYLGNYKH